MIIYYCVECCLNLNVYQMEEDSDQGAYESCLITLSMAQLRIQWLLAEAALKLIQHKGQIFE